MICDFCNECPSKDCCPEAECILFRIEKILNESCENESKEEE